LADDRGEHSFCHAPVGAQEFAMVRAVLSGPRTAIHELAAPVPDLLEATASEGSSAHAHWLAVTGKGWWVVDDNPVIATVSRLVFWDQQICAGQRPWPSSATGVGAAVAMPSLLLHPRHHLFSWPSDRPLAYQERLGEGPCGHSSPEGALVDADEAAHLSRIEELSRGHGLGTFNEIIQGV